jgi:hypothetical protein
MIRNGNSISADMVKDTIGNIGTMLFSDNLAVVWTF